LATSEPAQLYLASASPRRSELLAQIGVNFVVLPQAADERVVAGEAPTEYVLRIAQAKAALALTDPKRTLDLPVLSADTSVVLGAQIMGKPHSLADASAMLSALAGRVHQVMTAVVLSTGKQQWQQVVSSTVHFRELSTAEIAAYWQSGEPRDKAGAYAIQGRGALFVEHMVGSYSNVVGLPLFETAQLLSKVGLSSTKLLAGARL
jgi:septum formation protein